MRSRDRDRTKKNFQHNCLFKRFIIERQKETAETDDYEIIREVSYRASPVVSGDNGRQAVGRRVGAGNVASGSGAHRTAGGIGRETVPVMAVPDYEKICMSTVSAGQCGKR